MIEDEIPSIIKKSAKFGSKLGLERISELLNRLGNPQENLKVFHIAGTNGKGSVSAFLSSILSSSGYKTGVFTSPYLERFTEKIRIFDETINFTSEKSSEISTENVTRISKVIQNEIDEMIKHGYEHPTEFEITTAIALLYFQSQKCDYVVLETGLGGRYDSTNVVTQPVACIISALGYDHTDRLGDTIEKIAFEKAGIIKPCCPVFLYNPHDTNLSVKDSNIAINVIKKCCEEKKSKLKIVSSADFEVIKSEMNYQTFNIKKMNDNYKIKILGEYQIHNAILAAFACADFVDNNAIKKGLETTKWPGRMEILNNNPLVLIDGAHNPQGVFEFRQCLDKLFGETLKKNPPYIILGFMKDKDIKEMINILFCNTKFRYKGIVVAKPNLDRAQNTKKIVEYIEEEIYLDSLFYNDEPTGYNMRSKIYSYENVEDACGFTLESSVKYNSPVICVGSLYLIGEARPFLIESLYKKGE